MERDAVHDDKRMNVNPHIYHIMQLFVGVANCRVMMQQEPHPQGSIYVAQSLGEYSMKVAEEFVQGGVVAWPPAPDG